MLGVLIKTFLQEPRERNMKKSQGEKESERERSREKE